MKDFDDEIEKLYKLYILDDKYFDIEGYVFIESLFRSFIKNDLNDKFNLYIDFVKKIITQSHPNKLEHSIYILNEVEDNHMNVSTILMKDSKVEEPHNLLLNIYEISKICYFEEVSNKLKKVFYKSLNEFNRIDSLYYTKNQIARNDCIKCKKSEIFDDERLKDIKKHLKQLDSSIYEFDQIINDEKFTNSSLKFNKSHAEYQKQYWALSDSQLKIIEDISSNLSGVFFIEGVAGSGKSIVLLKLFELVNNREITTTSYFLTFTNSLVRFNQDGLYNTNYRKDLIKKMKTVDAYLSFNWKLDFKEYKILRDQLCSNDNNILMDLLKKSIKIFNENGGEFDMSSADAYNNIEHRIFEKLYTKEDCLKNFNSLDLYFISEIYRSLQVEKKVVSRAFSVVCMIEAIKRKGRKGYSDYLFVDEAQDLTYAQIVLLRLSVKKGLILAGDANQSIYLKESSLDKLPFNLKQYNLSENYRNPYEIKTLADCYIRSFNGDTSIKKVVYKKKANGLKPRLFKCSDVNSTIDLMIKKLKIDIDEFNLDLKDVLIICPSNYVITKVIERIELPIIFLKDRKVDFNESKIKISTIYSSKGCGFAYIYLIIDNKIYINDSFNQEEKDIALKRLIYVSLTRSMNSLNIFIPLSKFPLLPIFNLLEIME